MYGSEIVAKDVLEYVVFEKYIANIYGIWRIHDKIIPTWMPPRQSSIITYRVEEEEEKSKSKEEEEEKKLSLIDLDDKDKTVKT